MKQPTPLAWTDELVARFWDYESRFPENYFAHQVGYSVAEMISQYLHPNAKLLDYGAGPGHLLKHLIAKGIECTAIEFSDDSRKALDRHYQEFDLYRGAIEFESIPAFCGAFDAVCAIEVVEHLSDEHLSALFSSALTLLKPGGLLFITTPNSEPLANSNVYCPVCNHYFHRWQHLRSWDVDSLEVALLENHFEPQSVFTTRFKKENELNLSWKQRTRHWLAKQLKVMPPEHHFHLVAIAKKPIE